MAQCTKREEHSRDLLRCRWCEVGSPVWREGLSARHCALVSVGPAPKWIYNLSHNPIEDSPQLGKSSPKRERSAVGKVEGAPHSLLPVSIPPPHLMFCTVAWVTRTHTHRRSSVLAPHCSFFSPAPLCVLPIFRCLGFEYDGTRGGGGDAKQWFPIFFSRVSLPSEVGGYITSKEPSRLLNPCDTGDNHLHPFCSALPTPLAPCPPCMWAGNPPSPACCFGDSHAPQ